MEGIKHSKMGGPNRWVSAHTYAMHCGSLQYYAFMGLLLQPSNLPGYKETVLEYYGAMMKLGFQLCRGVALSLEIDENYFVPMMQDPMVNLRILHYPPQKPQDMHEPLVGAGAHTDYGIVTIVAQTSSGLQVRNRCVLVFGRVQVVLASA